MLLVISVPGFPWDAGISSPLVEVTGKDSVSSTETSVITVWLMHFGSLCRGPLLVHSHLGATSS